MRARDLCALIVQRVFQMLIAILAGALVGVGRRHPETIERQVNLRQVNLIGKVGVAGNPCLPSTARPHCASFGGVAEWLKAHAWKACVGKNLPRVRIPPPPPVTRLILPWSLTEEPIAVSEFSAALLFCRHDLVQGEYRSSPKGKVD